MRSVIFCIIILLFVGGCGDNIVANISSKSAITPIDSSSINSLYGTYNIVSFRKFESGSERIFSGDNITGEATIDTSNLYYRVEYNDDKHSYYGYNISDNQTVDDYNKIIDSILQGRDGNFIKSNYEIQIGNLGLVKVSDIPKSLSSERYLMPYKDRSLTAINVNDERSFSGTYDIGKVEYYYNKYMSPITVSSYTVGEVSLEYDDNGRGRNICDRVTFYKITSKRDELNFPFKFPYDGGECHYFRINDESLQIWITTTDINQGYYYGLTKRHDAIAF